MSEQQRFFNACSRSKINFITIQLFRRISLAGLPAVSGKILDEHYHLFDDALSIGEPYSHKNTVDPDQIYKAANVMKDLDLSRGQAAVDAASLVFAHSVLDDVTWECCQISASAAPEDWSSAVEKKMVLLEEIRNSTYDLLYSRQLRRYIEKELKDMSLRKRLDLVNQKCQPVSFEAWNYTYDPGTIERIDTLRQDIVHRVTLSKGIPTIEADLDYLDKTCRFALVIVGKRYNFSLPWVVLRYPDQ